METGLDSTVSCAQVTVMACGPPVLEKKIMAFWYDFLHFKLRVLPILEFLFVEFCVL